MVDLLSIVVAIQNNKGETRVAKYTAALLDIDDTILDFQATEHESLKAVLHHYHIPFSEENIQRYQAINRQLWQQYEEGKISRQQIFTERYCRFFAELGVEYDGIEADDLYREQLNEGHQVIQNSHWLLQTLRDHGYFIYAATNGIKDTQYRRLRDAGYLDYFNGLYISEEVGFQKPDERFFDFIFQTNHQLEVAKTVMIGDSLTADIRGGNRYGIDTVWFNPRHLPNDTAIHPTYEIHDLTELADCLELKS